MTQAASVLDLSEFPTFGLLDQPMTANLAMQSYRAQGSVTDLAAKIQAELQRRNFQPLEGANYTKSYATATFAKDGFRVSLSVTPAGKSGEVSVNLINHGNVELADLPTPHGAELLYAFPATISYVSVASPDEVGEAYLEQLKQLKWRAFGQTAVSYFVKQNAVRLQVMCIAAPGQEGRTTLQITSELLSADLPYPESHQDLQYSDSTKTLLFDTSLNQEAVVDFYRHALEADGWQATTTKPIRIDFEEYLIFRNSQGELIEVRLRPLEDANRVHVRFQTAAEFNAEQQRIEAAIERKREEHQRAADQAEVRQQLLLEAPSAASIQSQKNQEVQFSIRSGAAQATVAKWLAQLEADGWKVQPVVDLKEAGEFQLTKESRNARISFVDPGLIPGEITVSCSENVDLTVKMIGQ